MTTETDRIEKTIVLRAPRERIWRALTDAREFGEWFRVKLDGDFAVGQRIAGHITHPGFEHLTMTVTVERMDAGQLFSFRWHPYAIDAKRDYSSEPTTLVEFRLEEVAEGTRLTVVESGFDRVPAERRAEAFRMNAGGWTAQMENVRQHVTG
jgi:uncharacterized protein YndB with AHSA1/START domain